MYPWIDLYFIKIPSFGLMVASAFLICNHYLKKEFKKNIKIIIISVVSPPKPPTN